MNYNYTILIQKAASFSNDVVQGRISLKESWEQNWDLCCGEPNLVLKLQLLPLRKECKN